MDKSLLEHMRIDRNYFPRNLSLVELLQERSGYVPSISKIVNRICSSVDRKRLESKGEQFIRFKGLWIGDNCYVHIQVGDLSTGVRGEAVLRDAEIDMSESPKIKNVPINFYIGSDLKLDDVEFRTSLHHELTHMYDYLQRSVRAIKLQSGTVTPSEQRKFNKIMNSSVEVGVLDQLSTEIQKSEGYRRKLLTFISGCFYMCTPMEQNAFIAQMKAELQSKAGELKNYRAASQIIEHTQAWKNLKAVKNYLAHIQGLQKEHNRNTVVKWCTAFFGDSVGTFNKAVKRLEYELDSFERKLKSRLGKMCGELYQNSEEFLKEWRCSWNFQRPAQLEPIEDIEEDV